PSLVLPSDFLKRHRAETRQETVPTWYSPALPTVIAGAALALGVVLVGLLITRRASSRLVTGSAACVFGLLLFVNSSCSPRPNQLDRDDIHARRGGPSY